MCHNFTRMIVKIIGGGILASKSQRHQEEREQFASCIPTTLVAAFSLVGNTVKHIVWTFWPL